MYNQILCEDVLWVIHSIRIQLFTWENDIYIQHQYFEINFQYTKNAKGRFFWNFMKCENLTTKELYIYREGNHITWYLGLNKFIYHIDVQNYRLEHSLSKTEYPVYGLFYFWNIPLNTKKASNFEIVEGWLLIIRNCSIFALYLLNFGH